MTQHGVRLAQRERAALCDLALQLGPDAPTLSGAWTVRDLVVHLLVRERSPAAAGIVVRPLAGWTDAEMRRVARTDFAVLVERLRGGPPAWSPYALPRVDQLVNTLEFFVHHEDVRRAQPAWEPRDLADADQRLLWSMIRTAGKGLARTCPVGLTVENAATGARAVLKRDDRGSVTVRGLPAEVTLYVFGRTGPATVELLGDQATLDRLDEDTLGI